MRRLKTVRRPPIYPKTPGHLPCISLTHPLPLSSRQSIGVLRWIRGKRALTGCQLRPLVRTWVRPLRDKGQDRGGRSGASLESQDAYHQSRPHGRELVQVGEVLQEDPWLLQKQAAGLEGCISRVVQAMGVRAHTGNLPFLQEVPSSVQAEPGIVERAIRVPPQEEVSIVLSLLPAAVEQYQPAGGDASVEDLPLQDVLPPHFVIVPGRGFLPDVDDHGRDHQ